MNHGVRDDGVPDVQLDDLMNGGDGLHVVIVQAMAGVNREPQLGPMPGRDCAR